MPSHFRHNSVSYFRFFYQLRYLSEFLRKVLILNFNAYLTAAAAAMRPLALRCAEMRKRVVTINPETLFPCLPGHRFPWRETDFPLGSIYPTKMIMIIAGTDQTAPYFGNL